MTPARDARLSIYDAAAANRVRTAMLLGAFTLLIVTLGFVAGEYLRPGAGLAVMPFAVGLSALTSAGSYLAGDRIVLGMSGARELRADEEPRLRNIVEALAIGSGVPAPRLYLIEDTAPNAFATGRDPKHASVAVTRGLLEKLDRSELEAVLAHELSHIGNRDIRVMLLVVVLVGTVALLADWLVRSMWWGGRRGRDRDRGGAIAVLAFALALVTPVIATLIQLAVSREREYLADASAALLTRYPPALASALRKIAADAEPLEVANKATASLYFANPLKDRPAFFDGLFDTHPPVEERIRRLEAMG